MQRPAIALQPCRAYRALGYRQCTVKPHVIKMLACMLHAWLHHALKYQRGYSQTLSTVLPGQTQPEMGLVMRD